MFNSKMEFQEKNKLIPYNSETNITQKIKKNPAIKVSFRCLS